MAGEWWDANALAAYCFGDRRARATWRAATDGNFAFALGRIVVPAVIAGAAAEAGAASRTDAAFGVWGRIEAHIDWLPIDDYTVDVALGLFGRMPAPRMAMLELGGATLAGATTVVTAVPSLAAAAEARSAFTSIFVGADPI